MSTWQYTMVGFCDGIIKTSTFRAAIAACLDASIEVEMVLMVVTFIRDLFSMLQVYA